MPLLRDYRPPAMLVLLMMLNMAATTDRMVFGALAPVLSQALDLSDRQLALIQGAAFGMPYAAALPFAGWIVDRVGARRALIGAVLVWTMGMIVAAMATALPLILIGRGITGIGQAALTPAAFSLILATAAPAHAGKSLTLFTGAGTIGRGIAFVAAGALLTLFDAWGGMASWSATVLTLALVNLGVLAIGARHLRDGVRGAAMVWPALWHWLRRTPLTIGAAVVAALAGVVVTQALTAWMAIVVVRGHGTSAAHAALLIGLVGLVASPVGHLSGGAIADSRLGRVATAAVMLPCAIFVWAFVAAPSLAPALAMLALALVACGITGGIGLVRVQRLMPIEIRGTATGLFMTLVALVGISGGPLLVPVLSADIGLGLALAAGAAAAIAAAAGLLADRGIVARQ